MKRKRTKERNADRKIVERTNPGLGNKYAKEKLAKQLADARKAASGGVDTDNEAEKILRRASGFSSSQFFASLQRDQERSLSNVIEKKAKKKKKKRRKKMDSIGASGAFKL